MSESGDVERDRALLAAIIDSSDDSIISISLDGIILSWNGSAERLFGYNSQEAIGKKITLILPPEEIEQQSEILAQMRQGVRTEHFETVRITKEGKPVDISLTVSPIRDSSGSIIGASKIARDITARKQSEAALRGSEERFARFMQGLPGLAWIKDRNGRYMFANDAAVKAFRTSRAHLYGKTDDQIFPPHTAEQFKSNDRLVLENEAGVQVVETLEQEDGALHHSIVSKFPIPSFEGVPGFIGGIAIDITDRMRVEEALHEADRRKDEFLATLAHELRNPLAPIRNSLHILRVMEGITPSVKQVCDMMDRQVHQLVRLVDDLLELSRISRGEIELERRRFDLAEAIVSAVETSQPLIESSGHTLEISLPPEALPVEGDPIRLAQIFANLLNNAAKYTDRAGKIFIRAELAGDSVVVSVRDTGIGIPPEMLDRVFDMFAQVDRTQCRSQEGLGIGLHLVRSLVTMHGGTVEAKSEGPGKGSEFIVRLPSAGQGQQVAKAAEANIPKPLPAEHRILAVDDNRDSADSLGMLLQLLGAEVQVVYDGQAALDALSIFNPSVVLLDLGMAGMDGLEVARRIRQLPQYRTLMLVALTGWGQEEDRARSREAGFDHHLVKPVDLSELEKLLMQTAPDETRT